MLSLVLQQHSASGRKNAFSLKFRETHGALLNSCKITHFQGNTGNRTLGAPASKTINIPLGIFMFWQGREIS